MNQLFIEVSPIISATNNGRRTKLLPFEPSRCDESNGGGFVLLSPLDAEIIGKTSKNLQFYIIVKTYPGIENYLIHETNINPSLGSEWSKWGRIVSSYTPLNLEN